jgi:hypothetical protein
LTGNWKVKLPELQAKDPRYGISAVFAVFKKLSRDLLEIALQLAGHQDEVGILNLLSDSRERVCAGVGATEQGVVLV